MSERAKGEGHTWAVALLLAFGLLLAGVASACGDGEDPIDIIPPRGSPTATVPAAAATAEPTAPPTEFRVAYINLLSPNTLDETDKVPFETFDERLAIVIAELKEFKPDLVAFSEVTWTRELEDASAILARELKMEPVSVRTKPWFPGLSKEQNDKYAKDLGFEERELILVRSSVFLPAQGGQTWLNPRTSEIEVPGALWLPIKIPGQAGNLDVFLTHLTGGDAASRARQAADFAQFIKTKRGDGPILVLGDFGEPADSATVQTILELGLTDVFAGSPVQTCCRATVVGEQPELTQRTDFIVTKGWAPSAVGTFAHAPQTMDDGTLVYASDHNGLTAVFPLPAP